MTALFDYPRAAAYGRILPKSKIYAHVGANAKLRQIFVDQVNQIVWQYKLAPETINLPGTTAVTEIQIFQLSLRGADIDETLLGTIDRAIAYPIIFELTWQGRRRTAAAYKRQNQADRGKWVTSGYFYTDWIKDEAARVPMPLALNLESLYQQIISAILPPSPDNGAAIELRIERLKETQAIEREIERIAARLDREKQFNKRVAIHQALRAAQQRLSHLKG